MVPKIKKILYSSDLSESSIPALAWAMMLAHQHDAQISFLHVMEEVAPHTAHTIRAFMGEEQWLELNANRIEQANSEITERVGHFCDRVKSDIDGCAMAVKETIVKEGVPSQVIVEMAESDKFDLIVMGTHGAGVFKDAMIGSTARRVLRHTRTPVVVIPLPEEEG